MAQQIQLRHGTAAEAAASNPVLAAGEVGYTIDTNALKIGDGVSTWAALPAINGLIPSTDSLAEGSANLYHTAARVRSVTPSVQTMAGTALTLDAGNRDTYSNALIECTSSSAVTITVSPGFHPAAVSLKQLGAGTVTVVGSGGAVIAGDVASTIGDGTFVALVPASAAGAWTAVADQLDTLVSQGASGTESGITGVTGVEAVLWERVIPPGAIGKNDALIVKPILFFTNSAGVKSLRVRFGPSAMPLASRPSLYSRGPTTSASSCPTIEMCMRNSTVAAIVRNVSLTASDGYQENTSTPLTFVIDTEVENIVSVTAQLAVASDMVTLAYARAKIERGL